MKYLLSVVFLFLISFTVLCQDWQAAEWVNTAGKRDSGWVQIPIRKWRKLSSIQLKKENSNQYKKSIKAKNLVLVYTLDGDTLLNKVKFAGDDLLLQTLLKGEISLLRKVSRQNNYFITYKDSLIQLSNSEVTEQLPRLLDEDCMRFARRDYSYSTGGLIRITRSLNKCLHEEEPKWLSSKWSKYKWRYTVGLFSSDQEGFDISYDIGGTKKYHFQVGLERNLTASLPFLSFSLQTSYSGSTVNDDYYEGFNVGYDREIKRSFLKVSTGFRLEYFPRRTISPSFLLGTILAASLKSEWNYTLLDQNVSLNGLPSRQQISAHFPPEIGFFSTVGLRINLTTRTRLNLVIRTEYFPISDRKRYSDTPSRIFFGGIGNAHVMIPNEYMVGFTLARAFSMGL